jgi:alkane 1-monooxygenase
VTTQLSDTEIAQWRDKKRHLWLMGLIAPTALFVMLPLVWAFNQSGWHAAAAVPFWIGPILLYILLPALDLRFGPDGQNPPDEVMERLENDKYYRYCTYIYIPFQYASVILGAYLFTASDLSWLGFDGGLSWPAKIGLALSVGVLGGVGINTAHEMGHKKDELERWLSKITVGPVRRDVLGVPAAQRVGKSEVVVGAGGSAAASRRQESVALV